MEFLWECTILKKIKLNYPFAQSIGGKYMNRKLIKILMLLAYSLPYAYLAMYGDFNSSTLIFYLFMIVCFATLLNIAIKTKNIIVLILGNILSFISSYIFVLQNQTDQWTGYFKPFTPSGLLTSITVVAFLIQVLFIFNSKKRRNLK